MEDRSVIFRIRALSAERSARDSRNREIAEEWTQIAVEWHAVASAEALKTADPDLELI